MLHQAQPSQCTLETSDSIVGDLTHSSNLCHAPMPLPPLHVSTHLIYARCVCSFLTQSAYLTGTGCTSRQFVAELFLSLPFLSLPPWPSYLFAGFPMRRIVNSDITNGDTIVSFFFVSTLDTICSPLLPRMTIWDVSEPQNQALESHVHIRTYVRCALGALRLPPYLQ